MTPDGRLPSLTSSLKSETANNKVRKNQLPIKCKRRRTTSFFSNWQQYTEEEKNSFCRLNNRSFSEFKKARDSAAKLALHKKKKNQCPFCEKSYQQLVTFRRHLVAHFHCTQSNNPCNQHSKEQKQRESEAEQNHNEKPKVQNIATTKRTRYISLRNSEFCCLFCHTCFPNTAIDDIEHHLAKHSRLENITKELEAVIRTKTILTTSTSAANSPSPTSG